MKTERDMAARKKAIRLSSRSEKSMFLIGQYVRIIGRSERLIVGAIMDQWLFVGGQWWPTWLVVPI